MTDDKQHLAHRYDSAVKLQRSGDAAQALRLYDQIIREAPDVAQVHARRGEALWALGQLADCLKSFETAITLQPREPDFHYSRGAVLQALGQLDEALLDYRKVLAANPQHLRALNNQAVVLRDLGRVADAISTYDELLALAPANPHFHIGRSMSLLLLGRLREGWRDWEWRTEVFGPEGREPPDVPVWRGEELAGKRLLLQAEQGLGDTIQFSRYALVARDMGAFVILQVHDRLQWLLQDLTGVCVLGASARLPPCDYRLRLMSMPGLLEHQLADIPFFAGSIKADEVRAAIWRSRLGAAGFRIGIGWQGEKRWAGVEKPADVGRSFPVSLFAGMGALAGVRLISLQKNEGVEQLNNLPPGLRIEDLGPEFDAGPDGFRDTVAVMANLDLVITSDTALAHLAGTLGVPVWLALKSVPDWRWLLHRADCPWYPTMRLFRQQRRGDWESVFAAMNAELASMLAAFR
jgi:Flp pilus assembly protein TadD